MNGAQQTAFGEGKRRLANGKRQMANGERQTENDEHKSTWGQKQDVVAVCRLPFTIRITPFGERSGTLAKAERSVQHSAFSVWGTPFGERWGTLGNA